MPKLENIEAIEKILKSNNFNKAFLDGVIDFNASTFNRNTLSHLVWWLKQKANSAFLETLNLSSCELGQAYTAPYPASPPQPSYSSTGEIIYFPDSDYTPVPTFSGLVASMLSTYPWKRINLSHNQFSGPEIKTLLNGLNNGLFLEALDLSHNEMNDQAIKVLSFIINTSVHLHTLDLSYCKLTDAHLGVLSSALTGHPHLRVVNFKGNAFTRAGIEELSKIFHTNSLLVEMGVDSLEEAWSFHEDIEDKLKKNQTKRAEFQQALLTQDALFSQAVSAIEANNFIFFKILLGTGIDLRRNERLLEEAKVPYLFAKRMFTFKINVLREQLLQIAQFKGLSLVNSDNCSRINTQFKRLLQALSFGESVEPHERVDALSLYENELRRLEETQLLNEGGEYGKKLSPEAESRIKQSLLEYKTQVLIPACENLKLEVDDSTEWEALEKTLEEEINLLSQEEEWLSSRYTTMIMAQDTFKEETKQLNVALSRLKRNNKLPPAYQQEFTAIENALINANVNPADKNEVGLSLACMAIQKKQPRFLSLCLEKQGGCLFDRDETGKSILQQAVEEGGNTECNVVVIKYIKKRLTILWPNIYQIQFPEQTAQLALIKQGLDGYLDKLLLRVNMPPVLQTLTGASLRLEERKQDTTTFYEKLYEANQHTQALQTLEEMLVLADNIRTGWFNRSELKTKMTTLIRGALPHFDTEDYRYRIEAVRKSQQDAANREAKKAEAAEQRAKDEATLRLAAEQEKLAAEQRAQEEAKKRLAAEQEKQTAEQRAQTAEAEVARLKEALLQQQKPASPSQGGFFSPHSSPPVSNPVPPAPSSFTPAFTRTPEEH